MDLNELKIACFKKIKENPTLRSQVLDIYEMARDEIQDGGSVENEVELAFDSLEEL